MNKACIQKGPEIGFYHLEGGCRQKIPQVNYAAIVVFRKAIWLILTLWVKIKITFLKCAVQ